VWCNGVNEMDCWGLLAAAAWRISCFITLLTLGGGFGVREAGAAVPAADANILTKGLLAACKTPLKPPVCLPAADLCLPCAVLCRSEERRILYGAAAPSSPRHSYQPLPPRASDSDDG
jgi:hypothetical protein